MTLLLELKERLKVFYNKNTTYLIPIMKFMLALIFFTNINLTLGFMSKLNNVFVVLILSLVCSLISFQMMLLFGCILVIGHCYAVGIEVAVLATVLLLLMLLLYLRFAKKDALGIILTPVAFALNIPCAVPIGFGLLSNPVSAFASACGVVFYYFMLMVKEKAVLLQGMKKSELSKKFQILMDGIMQNQAMWITIVAFIAIVITVYYIRRMSVNHAWQTAIISGGIIYLLLQVGGGFFLDLDNSLLLICIQVLLSCVLMFVLKFFAFNVDYTRTEYLQYEDDDYYYYVKAVPKVKITQQKRFVKTISEERTGPPKKITSATGTKQRVLTEQRTMQKVPVEQKRMREVSSEQRPMRETPVERRPMQEMRVEGRQMQEPTPEVNRSAEKTLETDTDSLESRLMESLKDL